MGTLKLGDDFLLSAEINEKKIRLVIYKNDVAFVCRRTSAREINVFLEGPDTRLFRGRLQLFKDDNNILVLVKDTLVGIISHEAIKAYVANAGRR